jgi:hypothetical protein
MSRGAIISDCFGKPWLVDEVRPTAHGWCLYLGRPLSPEGISERRGSTAIATPKLRDHLAATMETPYDVDLPLSGPAIARLRKLLGLTWREYRRQWWEERTRDLDRMTEEEFGRKHGVAQSAVSWKLKRIGKPRRPRGRWNDEEVVMLLASPGTCQAV